MSKPIFIIGIPDQKFESMEKLDGILKMIEKLSLKMTDYYVIWHLIDSTDINFNVFYEKDFNQTTYNELKSMIQNEFNKIKEKIINETIN